MYVLIDFTKTQVQQSEIRLPEFEFLVLIFAEASYFTTTLLFLIGKMETTGKHTLLSFS